MSKSTSILTTIGEHRIRAIHQCYTIEYLQTSKSGEMGSRWKETGFYPATFESALLRLMEFEIKRRGRCCVEAQQLLEAVQAMRDEIVALPSV
jgi:hypothetical protein